MSTTETPVESKSSESGNQNEELREATIVFFDGVCGLCNGFVNFLLDRDSRQRLRFAPLQGETAAMLLDPADTHNLHSVVFMKGDRQWRRSSAVVRIFLELGGVWALLGGLMWMIPKPLRDFGYKLVANFRYRLFGKQETCRMPKPGEAERMLE
ncbi:MAG: thiol-disulfide oxidoreductase DCC family protein [Planctomycetaceae bacterium]|nr:thiol-disulfide oxidoreductase DCC family protein [Planctomycetaceae bacterium]